jgi:hypothetical protein
VVLTGALSTRRTDMVRLLKQAGAKIGSGVSKNTDILVAGDKVHPGPSDVSVCGLVRAPVSDSCPFSCRKRQPGSKLTKAEALGVTVWQEEKVPRHTTTDWGVCNVISPRMLMRATAPARSPQLLKELKKAGIDEDAVGEAGEAEDAVPDVQLLLANKWTPSNNPTGWWMSEKLDGVRAYWNGRY